MGESTQVSEDIQKKIDFEKATVSKMVGIYCRGNNHAGRADVGPCTDGSGLCPDCRELLDYALARVDRCPHMATKTFCSACETHCYSPQMRERIRQAMAYAGPRMLLHDPKNAIRHLAISRRDKRRAASRQHA